MKITPYHNKTEAIGDNVSAVWDQLIRLTAKITSSYASDIVYVIREFEKARKNGVPYYAILAFRESGVNSYKAVDFITDTSEFIQVWELKYDPDKGIWGDKSLTTLRRVWLN